MVLDGWWQVFLGGMLGWVLLELVKLSAWRDSTKVKARYEDWRYWVGTVAVLVLGGAVAVANGISHVPVLKAMEFGLTAPAVITGYATGRTGAGRKKYIELAPRAKGAPRPSLTELFSWL